MGNLDMRVNGKIDFESRHVCNPLCTGFVKQGIGFNGDRSQIRYVAFKRGFQIQRYGFEQRIVGFLGRIALRGHIQLKAERRIASPFFADDRGEDKLINVLHGIPSLLTSKCSTWTMMLSNLHRQKCQTLFEVAEVSDTYAKASDRTVLAAESHSAQAKAVEGSRLAALSPDNDGAWQPETLVAESSFMAGLKDKDADRPLA